jgi:hypothetical protein
MFFVVKVLILSLEENIFVKKIIIIEHFYRVVKSEIHFLCSQLSIQDSARDDYRLRLKEIMYNNKLKTKNPN